MDQKPGQGKKIIKLEAPEKRGQLFAAAAEVEITPPLEVGLLMSSAKQLWEPFDSKRLPLMARVLLLKADRLMIAVCSLDLLGLSSTAVGGWARFKQRISDATENLLSPVDIIITSTHTHTAPESLALSDLYRTNEFQQWVSQLVASLGKALIQANRKLAPVDILHGSATVSGLSLSRRIKTAEGIKLSHELPAHEIPAIYHHNVDERVQVICFRGPGGALSGLLVHAVCHPVIEMCIRNISPDYPGELSLALQERYGVPALFLNGASANINPVEICGGPEKAKMHAAALMEGAVKAIENATPLPDVRVSFQWKTIPLPARDAFGNHLDSPMQADLALIQLGKLGLLFLPGEIFLETGLAIEKALLPRSTIIVGFAEAYIGYVCPLEVFKEGGYEAGPGRWSVLQPGAEEILRRAAIQLSITDNSASCQT